MERHTAGKTAYTTIRPPPQRRNGAPVPGRYTWAGEATGMPEDEVQARVAAAKARALALHPEARTEVTG